MNDNKRNVFFLNNHPEKEPKRLNSDLLLFENILYEAKTWHTIKTKFMKI